MATVTTPRPAHDPRIDDANHPIWLGAFSSETRYAQVDEDLEAGSKVTGVLIAIVTGGLVLGLIGVIAALSIL